MLLFSKKPPVGVQSFLLRYVNSHCPELGSMLDNRREESRIPICEVTIVVPIQDGKLQMAEQFPTVTKEFSTTGVSIVLDHPRGLEEVALAFRSEKEMTFLKGIARHLNPMGAGFYHLGIELNSVVRANEYPELENLYI